jgi:hypothetical protein
MINRKDMDEITYSGMIYHYYDDSKKHRFNDPENENILGWLFDELARHTMKNKPLPIG